MKQLYPVKAEITLNGSGAGSATIKLNGALLCLNVGRSTGTPTISITDGYAACLSSVAFAANAQRHPQAPIYTPEGVDSGLKTLFVYSEAHDVTITITGGTAASVITIEFFLIPMQD